MAGADASRSSCGCFTWNAALGLYLDRHHRYSRFVGLDRVFHLGHGGSHVGERLLVQMVISTHVLSTTLHLVGIIRHQHVHVDLWTPKLRVVAAAGLNYKLIFAR